MKKVVIIGAGKIGRAIATMLASSSDYHVTVADRSDAQLAMVARHASVSTQQVDITNEAALDALLAGNYAVLSALPYDLTVPIAQAAARCSTHYLDLTEDVASTQSVKALAATADRAFIPQCGLAPGFVSIVAADLGRRLDSIDGLRLRVGALPQFPSNALNYNLTWSTEGVINEYCEPCEAIVNGKRAMVTPLEEREEFSLDGVTYEAFNTSGGLGSLCETLEGKVRTLNYRTIRYPGHAAIMRALLHDLRLAERRDVLKDIFEKALPSTMQDVVVIFVTATGRRNDQLVQETYANKIYSRTVGGEMQSAIQATTSAGVCAVLDLLAKDRLPQRGFIKPEQVTLIDFLENRFGRIFARSEDTARAA